MSTELFVCFTHYRVRLYLLLCEIVVIFLFCFFPTETSETEE